MGRGDWTRWDARRRVEGVLFLDIRKLSRGWLPDDGPRRHTVRRFTVAWHAPPDPFLRAADLLDPPRDPPPPESSVSVGLLHGTDALILYQEGGEQRSERVKLDSTPCNYGGERFWWLCPTCGRRCAILYLQGSRFECRTCGGLAYTTAQVSRWVRSARKSAALRERLGLKIGDRYGVKPRGMHWRTFERLVAECQRASAADALAFAPVLERWEAEHESARAELERYFTN